MASVLLLTLKNGGLTSITANYLNPSGTGVWGNESLKILGSSGFVESTAGGKHTRLVVGDQDHGPLDTTKPGINWLDTFFTEIAASENSPSRSTRNSPPPAGSSAPKPACRCAPC